MPKEEVGFIGQKERKIKSGGFVLYSRREDQPWHIQGQLALREIGSEIA